MVLAQAVTPTPEVPGIPAIDVPTSWISSHFAWLVGVGGLILDVVFRLWPSDKVRSIFSYAGRLAGAIGKLLFLISDLISKIVPDRRAVPPTPPPAA